MADTVLFTPQGVIVPDTAVFLADVQAEYQEAFSADLNLSPETPQGMLISMEADARDAAVRLAATVANQFNPNLAQGVFLDCLCALTGLKRRGATRSSIVLTLTGVPGTVVPAGSRARVELTDAVFFTTRPAVIPASRTVNVDALSVDVGPVDAATGTVTSVVSAVLGWETVTNPSAPVLGRLEELDGALRLRRRETLGLQSTGLLIGLKAALLDTADVRSCQVRENYENEEKVVDGVTLKPHSVWACVDGGTDDAVAATLLRKKSLGAGWNGALTVPVVEPASGQTYPVQFDRPDEVPIFMTVVLRAGSPLADPDAAVREAIQLYRSGQMDGEEGLGVGADVSAFEIAGAINRYNPALFVQQVMVSKSFPATTSTTVVIEAYEIASVLDGNIQVIGG